MNLSAKIFIVLLLIARLSEAQKVSDEIIKIKQVYEENSQMAMDVSYKVFANHYAANPIETTTGSYKKRGKEMHSYLHGMTTIQNSKFLFTIDPEQQSILVSNPKKRKGLIEGLPLDTLLSIYSKYKVSSLDKNNKKITLSFMEKEADIPMEAEKIELYFNSTTYLIYKFVIYYAEAMSADEKKPATEKPRLEIAFSHVTLTPTFEKDDFSEKVYFIKKGNTLIGVDSFKGFGIIDQRVKR